jgi:hypothetical protein
VLTKFICSLVIGISLLFIPTPASAEDVIINLDATTAYVDVVVQVDTTTAYTITTTTGPRTEVVDSQTVERVAWVDSWLWLYRGVADSTTVNPIRGDDDSNHTQNNWLASAISGTLNADTYTIRATSYDYVVAGQRPIGTYTLSSNLIPPRDTSTVVVDTSTVVVDTGTVIVDTNTVVVDTNTVTVDGTTATVDTSTAVVPTPTPEPPVVVPEPPAMVYIPPIVEPEPPVTVEEPPIEPIEPPVEAEEPPIEAEEPPDVEEEAPVPVEEPPIEEELPTEEEELPAEEEPELVQVDEVELETLAPETPVELSNGVVVTAETAIAIQLLQDPAALLQEIFTNPVAALAALGSVGADMTEEVREESEKVIIAAVIAGNIATQAAATAGAVAAYRRKP